MKKLILALALASAFAAPALAQFVPTPSPASNLTPTRAGQAIQFTPGACNAAVITTGGTGVNVKTAGTIINAIMIANPIVATEPLFVSFGATATLTAGGVNFSLTPGASMTFPGGDTLGISANAATSAHAFSCMFW